MDVREIDRTEALTFLEKWIHRRPVSWTELQITTPATYTAKFGTLPSLKTEDFKLEEECSIPVTIKTRSYETTADHLKRKRK